MKIRTLTFLLILNANYLAGQSIEQLLSYSFPTNLTASPHGDYIAWVSNTEGVRNIFVAKGPEYTPVQITSYTEDDGQDLGNLLFAPDQESLYYVRGGSPNRSGEFPNPTSDPEGVVTHINKVDIESKEITKIANGGSPRLIPGGLLYYGRSGLQFLKEGNEEGEKLFEARGGVSSIALSPDGKKIAFSSSRGTHSFIGIYDLETGTLEFPDPSIDRDSNPVWSPDGKQVAFFRTAYAETMLFTARRKGYPFSIRVIDVGQEGSREVFLADQGTGSVFRSISGPNLIWLKDGNLVFPWEKEGWTHLWSIPSKGGKASNLTPGKFEVQYVSTDGSSVFYSSNQDDIDRQHVWKVAPGNTTKLLTPGTGVEWSPVTTTTGNVFYIGSSGTSPASVYAIENGKIRLIHGSTDYPSKSLNAPEQVVFSAADGMKIHAQLFLPPNLKKDEKRPAILFFHGGSRRQMLLGFHHRGYYHNAFAMNHYLAQQGYIVLSVNFRSGIGYGMEFREAINYGAGGASEFNDVMGAGLFMQRHPNVDPGKIGLWGGSYGGYLTALGLARASDLFKAGVDIHGVTDWNPVIKGFVPSYDPKDYPEFAELAYESSPIAHMSTWRSPVLLIHGDDDRNVPFKESIDKANLLRKYGVEFEQLVFPDEVHGFLLHSNWLKAYRATADFFDRKLK